MRLQDEEGGGIGTQDKSDVINTWDGFKNVAPSFHLRPMKSEFEEGMSGHLNFLKNALSDFNVQTGLRIIGRVQETNQKQKITNQCGSSVKEVYTR